MSFESFVLVLNSSPIARCANAFRESARRVSSLVQLLRSWTIQVTIYRIVSLLTTQVCSCIFPNLGRMNGLKRGKLERLINWAPLSRGKALEQAEGIFTSSGARGRSGWREGGCRRPCRSRRPSPCPSCEPCCRPRSSVNSEMIDFFSSFHFVRSLN